MDDWDGHQNNLQYCILNFCSGHPGLSCFLKPTGIQKPAWTLWSDSHWNSWSGPQSHTATGNEWWSVLVFACTHLPWHKEMDHLRELDFSGPPRFCLMNFPVCSRKPEWCLWLSNVHHFALVEIKMTFYLVTYRFILEPRLVQNRLQLPMVKVGQPNGLG